tara:strand:- start:302 stop:922 length:621 start_codon:yes stop_codon:yes gene_type:complete
MYSDEKELAEIKGYVGRLYQLIRSRTEISLELSDRQAEEFTAVGDTIQDINTKLQIANSFQQEEIFEELKIIAKVLRQLVSISDPSLSVEDEKFTKVDTWKTLKIVDSYGGPMAVFSGDLIGFVCSESDNSINIREIYSAIAYSGQGWRKIGFEPYSILLEKTQEIYINKKSLLYITTPSESIVENLISFRTKYAEYRHVLSPWQF